MRTLGNGPNWPAVAVMAALVPALFISVAVFFPGTAAAEIRNVTSTADTSIRENLSTTTYGGSDNLRVDGDEPGGSGKDAYSLLRWGLSSVPSGSKVDSASVTVNVTNPSTQTYQIYDLKRPWVESAATWLQYASGSAWEVAGAKGSLDRGAQVGSVSPSVTGKRTFALSTSVVQKWIDDPSSNRGIIIANAANTDGFVFLSRQAADASLRPSLSVNYSATTTPPPADTSPPETTIDSAPSGTVSSASASFAFTSSEAGSTFECKLDTGAYAPCTSPKSYTNLSNGSHTFSVRAKDAAGNTDATPAERTWTVSTAPPPADTCNKGQFFAQYRNELRTFNTQPVLTRCETAIDNDWGSGSPGSGANTDSFTARWVGRFDFEASGYEFEATADDGVRLWVDGQLVIDQWKDQAAATYNATENMTAGEHEVIVEYYENLGAAVARVSWAKVAPPPPPTGDETNVCAHWHHSAQRAVMPQNTVEAYRLEIQRAKAMGVECFAYNVVNISLELPEIDKLYEAANLEGNFKLFPSADTCCSMSEADMDRLMLHRYDDPARMRVDGGRYGENLPVAQTWHGENKSVSEWKRIQDEWAAAGKPMFFIPYFHPYNGVETDFDRWNGTVDGLYNFNGFASGDNAIEGSQTNHQYDLAADARPGMDAMFSCTPVFNRHSGSSAVENRILGDFEGFHAWLTCLEGMVRDNPRFVEFTTWNDYLEGTYLGGPYPNSDLWPTFRGNDLSHNAYREIAEYYIRWYETGQQPQMTTDKVAIAHRLHPENAPGVNINGTGIGDDTDSAFTNSGGIRPLVRQTDYSVVEDRLYAAVILKQPAQVRLTSGTATQTFEVQGGVSEVSMPFAAGTQKLELLRGGTVVLTATSARQLTSGAVSLFNYNYQTAYAEG